MKPKIGSIKSNHKSGRGKFIYLACPKCGKERWVRLRTVEMSKVPGICLPCACRFIRKNIQKKGKESFQWRGGRCKTSSGYIEIYLDPSDFFYPMAHTKSTCFGSYVMEHRLAVAKSLGRNLHRWEIVHHKNHIKDDNRIENLQLVTDDRHNQITILEKRIAYLEAQVAKLKNNHQ